jgi:hypothetical protein
MRHSEDGGSLFRTVTIPTYFCLCGRKQSKMEFELQICLAIEGDRVPFYILVLEE